MHLSYLNLDNIQLRIKSHNLDQLTIDGLKYDDFIDQAINVLPKLRLLNLDNFEIQENRLQKSYPAIEEISITEESALNLASFIKRSPHVKKISCTFKESLNLTEDYHLPYLETLDLSYGNNSFADLKHIIAHSATLEDLNLRNCENLKDYTSFSVNLPNLKTLDVSESDIKSENLQQLLWNAPGLTSLTLSECPNLSETLTQQFNTQSLKYFIAKNSNINTESIHKIIYNATHLELLDLECSGPLNAEVFSILNPMPDLEYIDLNGTKISNENLETLLTNAPNIKTLFLKNSDYPNHLLELYP